ncbi:MAG TPA: guanylate kinase [Candidatus Acidoferrales bacterium]|jgi:guanylate kinase|nr:guanylate kinase [Candidatus Acidoferrales bacterium]
MAGSTSRVLIVSGPSGSGKSTLVQKLQGIPGLMFSVSSTTRPPRLTESPGKCYDFITEAEFKRRVELGEFLEYAQVFGRHWYGTPRKQLDDARRAGLDLVLEIDVNGMRQVKGKLPEAIAVFIVPPSRQDLEQRLRSRGQDADEAIARRLERARQEIASSAEYDFVIVNDDLKRASDELRAITVASRCRTRDNHERLRKIIESFGG